MLGQIGHSRTPALSLQAHLVGRVEAQVPHAEIEDLLDTCPGVEQQREERVVALAAWPGTVDALQKRGHLRRVEVLDGWLARTALEGEAEHGLKGGQVLGAFRDEEARERVESGKTGIARCDTVAADGLEVVKEPDHPTAVEVGDLEPLDRATGIVRREAQEEHESIAVALDGVRAQAAEMRQILFEEAAHRAAEFGGSAAAHRPVSWIRWPLWRAKRSLASAASVGMKCR